MRTKPKSLLHSNRPHAPHIIFHTNQLRSLDLPQRLLLLLTQSSKEIQPPGEQLAFVGVVEPTGAFAGVGLRGCVWGERLVVDGGYGADGAGAAVEDLVGRRLAGLGFLREEKGGRCGGGNRVGGKARAREEGKGNRGVTFAPVDLA